MISMQGLSLISEKLSRIYVSSANSLSNRPSSDRLNPFLAVICSKQMSAWRMATLFPNPNAACDTAQRRSRVSYSITSDILVSDFVIICILIFSSVRNLSIKLASLAWDRISTTTKDSFAMLSTAPPKNTST